MSYSQMISRNAAEALIPQDVAKEIMQLAPDASVVMKLGRRLPNMSAATRKLPVLSALIAGGFVEGDTGLKQTSAAAWEDKQLVAAEIAVIVPIPEAVLDDADYDIWGQIKPQIAEEFGRIFDRAVLFGEDAPEDWPMGIAEQVGGNAVSSTGNLWNDIMGTGGVIAKVEGSGYMVNGHVAATSMRGLLRAARTTEEVPIFQRSGSSGRYELDGEPVYFPMNGAMKDADSALISGDWSQLVWSVRQDMTYKILDQAVISDAGGNIVYNLAQQDMVALRAVMRVAWQVANPARRTASSGFPFATLVFEA